jgi:hypothetical protein
MELIEEGLLTPMGAVGAVAAASDEIKKNLKRV